MHSFEYSEYKQCKQEIALNDYFFLALVTVKQPPKKNASVQARLPDNLRARLDAIHKAHLTNDSTVTVHMLEAFCDYVEEAGTVKFPAKLVPANEPKTLKKSA